MPGIRQRIRRRPGASPTDPATAPPVDTSAVSATAGPVADPNAPAAGAAGPAAAGPPGPSAPAAPAASPAGITTPMPVVTPPATPGPEVAAAPAPPPAPSTPGFATRGKLRRRLRYLRRVRELGYRDLGGLVFDQHRFARPNEGLVQTKVSALAQIDGEVRALEHVLEDRRVTTELREAGIAACPRCGAIHGSESRYCPACGLALTGPTELAQVHPPVAAPIPAPRPAYAPAPSGYAPTPYAAQPAPASPPAPAYVAAPAHPPAPVAQPAPVPPAAAPAPPAPAAAPAPAGEPADQPTTVFRAADVGAAGVSGDGIVLGDPLAGPREAPRPGLTSGDPLAPRSPNGDAGSGDGSSGGPATAS